MSNSTKENLRDICSFSNPNHIYCLLSTEKAIKDYGDEVLESAIIFGRLEIVQHLLDHGVNLKITSILTAAKYGRLDIIAYLYESCGVPLNVKVVDAAVEHGHIKCVKYVLERTYNYISSDTIHIAISNSSINCLEYFRDKLGMFYTSMHLEFAVKQEQVLSLLYFLSINIPITQTAINTMFDNNMHIYIQTAMASGCSININTLLMYFNNNLDVLDLDIWKTYIIDHPNLVIHAIAYPNVLQKITKY